MKRVATVMALTALALPSVLAAPMGFKDSWMAMADFSPNWREGFVNYAFTARDAVGPSLLYMRSDDKATTRELAEVAYTRLVTRWNLPHAQANVWFIGGIGAVRGSRAAGRYVHQLRRRIVKATVNGMVCAFCAQGIEKRLSKMTATKAVFVDLKNKIVAVEVKPDQPLDQKAITAEITDAGYDVVKLEAVPMSVAEIKAQTKGRK